MQILIVEDDDLIAMVIEEALSELNEVVLHRASSFTDAKDWLPRSEQLDLILLDNYLGDGEGADLLPYFVHETDTDQVGPVVMMLSGNNDQEFLSACFDKGAADYLIKPFNVGLLTLKVEALLREKQLRDEILEKNQRLDSMIAEAAQEEDLARFTYDYLISRNRDVLAGVAGKTSSTRAFSGDILLQHRAPDGKGMVMLGDATGHGLSAAITLLPVVYTFHAMIRRGFPLESIIVELNKRLLEDTPEGRFVGAVIMELDWSQRHVRIWNGGMPSMLCFDKHGKIQHEVHSEHMPLGVLPQENFDVDMETHPIQPGQHWLAYSDGITEQRNREQAFFGDDRLLAAFRAGITGDTEADPVESIMNALDSFREEVILNDDASCLHVCPQKFVEAGEAVKKSADTGLVDWSGTAPFEVTFKAQGPGVAGSPPAQLVRGLMPTARFNEGFMQKFHLVVTELVNNAVDHGLLRLDSSLKEGENGFLVYAEEREKRLKNLSDSDFVRLEIRWNQNGRADGLEITVQDSGPGFISGVPLPEDGCDLAKTHGRGLALVCRFCSSLTFKPPGNTAVAILPVD